MVIVYPPIERILGGLHLSLSLIFFRHDRRTRMFRWTAVGVTTVAKRRICATTLGNGPCIFWVMTPLTYVPPVEVVPPVSVVVCGDRVFWG